MLPFFYGYTDPTKKEIADHLIRLSPEDRTLRFFGNVTDEFIHKYVSNSTKNGSFWVVVGDASVENIVGAMHVAFSDDMNAAEVGFSVEEEYKGQGIATALMKHAIAVLKIAKVKSLVLNCLAENKAVQAICKKFGFDVSSVSFSEKEGILTIQNDIDIKDMIELTNLTQGSFILPFISAVTKSVREMSAMPSEWLKTFKEEKENGSKK